MSQPQETALVLSGGGAYGAFSVGVMKVLFAGRSPATGYKPLEAGIFTGTSVGAFNASVMAGHPNESCLETAFRLEKLWLDQMSGSSGEYGNSVFRLRDNPLDYLGPDGLRNPAQLGGQFIDDLLATSVYLVSRTANFLASSRPLVDRILTTVNISSFIDSRPCHELLRRVIDEQAIRESPKKLEIIATNWITGEVKRFHNRDFHDGQGVMGITASASIPGVFPPVSIDESLCVDGGVVDNTPVSSAIGLGADELHVIYLLPTPTVIPLQTPPATVDTMMRVYFLMLASIVNEDIETARWINAGKRAVLQHMAAPDAEEFLRTVGEILGKTDIRSSRLVTIHRYLPRESLGGDLGMLDFSRGHLANRIAEGERVALLHDCEESRCVLANE
jgi:predicted acylesterase/phospholipase RssA